MTAVPQSPFPPYTADVPPPPRRASGRGEAGTEVVGRYAREIHELLRRRLLITVAVAVGFFGILPIGSMARVLAPDVPDGARLVLLSQSLVALVIAGLGVVIWRWPPPRLRHLRALELVIFGIIVAYLIVSNGYYVVRFAILAPPIEPVLHPILSMDATRLDSVTLRWLIVIVGYGTLIPNTWRRSLTIIFIMVALHLAQLVAQGVMSGLDAREIASMLLYPVVWMAVGTVVAVFGSYRVSLLERRVQEAERLGQYRLKRFLGAGGMGDVYLAEHVLLKQPFAVKLLRPERILDERTQQRFEAEVQAMARLQHWNTVEIYDYGHAADGSFYYVMEYLPGLTLEQIVAQHGPMPSGRTIRMLLQVCNALNEAHSMAFTHRDIKPGNILVCDRAGIYDVAKLLDFGLVKHIEDADQRVTGEGLVAGTPAYMSPEQAAGYATADVRSDIYSLGAVGYFLLTGRPPFSGRTATHVLAAHIYEPPPRPSALRPDVDPALDAVIHRCLAKNPEQRYPNVESLAQALRQCPTFGSWSQTDAIGWWRTADRAAQPAHAVGD